MLPEPLQSAADSLPAGRYAVGVSGGADSVALLHLLHRHRPELHLHIVHLDHETRGGESTQDAQFVRQLAEMWRLPHTFATRGQVEPLLAEKPANTSALYRALRLELFRQVVAGHGLDAVLLAHHADDQAETVLHRLLRGSGVVGLAGIAAESRHGELLIRRPLLDVPGGLLRQYLRDAGQSWREDASNASDQYLRNRLRRVLASEPRLAEALREMGQASEGLRRWVRSTAPELPEVFDVSALSALPELLAQESARRWLVARGVPPQELLPAVAQRLIDMAADAASPPRQDFPGRLRVRRQRGRIAAERP